MNRKIAVFGTGYVGLSNAILLAQHNDVIAVDIVEEKVKMINSKLSPIADKEIEHYLKEIPLNLSATTNGKEAILQADYVIICTPTNYDPVTNYFDTRSVEQVLNLVSEVNPKTQIVIKSTIPVGYTQNLINNGFKNVFFVPEFLREGKALYDNLYPSRIVIGSKSQTAKEFASLLVEGAIDKNAKVLYTNSTEAEAIKLFSNTYLAMRVAFFNELDSYCLANNLNSKEIISGVGLDPRIGEHYRNPSFGYGGYCLPKDTKQLLANFSGVPQTLISAIVESNTIRKNFISQLILEKKPKTVGVYRLVMKTGSDNFRESAIQDIIKTLLKNNVKVIIYEPSAKRKTFMGCELVENLEIFKSTTDLIIANRFSEELKDVGNKVFTRDIFGNN